MQQYRLVMLLSVIAILVVLPPAASAPSIAQDPPIEPAEASRSSLSTEARPTLASQQPFTLTLATGIDEIQWVDIHGGSGSAVLTWIHPWWTAIPGASWVWNEYLEDTPNQGNTVTFTQVFTLPHNIQGLNGSIEITADDTVVLYLNDSLVADLTQVPFLFMRTFTFGLEDFLQPGTNEIKAEVVNKPQPGGTSYSNPGGLLYRAIFVREGGEPSPPLDHPIVLLPGIMGSKLSNEPVSGLGCLLRPHGEVWPNLARLAAEVADNLVTWPHIPSAPIYNEHLRALHLRDGGEHAADNCDKINVSGIIDQIDLTIANRGVRKDFYASFNAELQNEGYTVSPFAYDWRLDVETIAQALNAHIARLAPNEQDKVILIGHSLGGLVARQYVSDENRAQKVEKVITVGTPYWGLPQAAKHMRAGTTPLPFDWLLDKGIMWNIHRNSAAAMQILPSEAYFSQLGIGYYVANVRQLNTYNETRDFFDSRGHNTHLINAARDTHLAIDNFNDNLHVDSYYVLAANHMTADALIREFPCYLGLRTCWDVLVYARGDGRVPWLSARLRGRLADWSGSAQVCTFSDGLTKSHGELLSDTNVIEDIRRLLRGDAPQHCDFQEVIAQTIGAADSLLQIAVWGEARVSVQDATGNFTGITEEGLIVNEIPLASYDLAGPGTFIVLPTNMTYTLKIEQESDIPVQMRISDMRAPSIEDQFKAHERAVFVDVPAEAGGVARLELDLDAGLEALRLEVDLDDDGEPDLVLPPTSVLDEEESQDITPPTTTVDVDGDRDEWSFYTGPVTVTLFATDVGTGVLKTEYSLDRGKTWLAYTDPFQIRAEDVPVLHARSVDRAGNHEYPWPQARLRPHVIYMPSMLR